MKKVEGEAVDPASIVVPESATIIPDGFTEITSINEAIIDRMALERAFLDRVKASFTEKTKLTKKQLKSRAASKRARAARKVQRQARKR